MAHVGKLYPVLDRRDLCLNCNQNIFALPQNWKWSFDFTVVTTGSPRYMGVTGIMAVTSAPFEFAATWEGPPITQHSRTFVPRAVFEQADDGNFRTRILWQMLDGATIVAEWRGTNASIGLCNRYVFTGFQQTQWSDAFWGGPALGGGSDMEANAVVWSQLP